MLDSQVCKLLIKRFCWSFGPGISTVHPVMHIVCDLLAYSESTMLFVGKS